MSLFLVYVELGAPKPFVAPPHPLVLQAVEVHNEGRSGPSKHGWVITDGLASDYLLQYGTRVVARQGEILREGLFKFLAGRIAAGARPVLCFVLVHAQLSLVSIPIDKRELVPIGQLPQRFSQLAPMDVLEITR
jgi:hypothetical protein